jgi:hypothetical protein
MDYTCLIIRSLIYSRLLAGGIPLTAGSAGGIFERADYATRGAGAPLSPARLSHSPLFVFNTQET